MITPKLPHIDSFRDRHGRVRYYFRRKHGLRTALPGEPFSEEFMAAYRRALGSKVAPPSSKHAPGSFHALAALYFSSTAHLKWRESSKEVTRRILERFLAEHGHRLVADMQRRDVEILVGQKSKTPAAANSLLKKLHMLLNFAIRQSWIKSNPADKFDKFKEGEHHTWTESEIEQFETRWTLGSRERTAFALHLYTGQRRSDCVRMTWGDLDGPMIRVTQAKTGTRLAIPIHAELKKALELWPRKHLTILYSGHGRQYTVESYGNLMADAIAASGLPERCVLHGLRKAAARRLAEAGCTEKQIAAVTGHKTLAEVARYTRDANQEQLATAAIMKLPGGRK